MTRGGIERSPSEGPVGSWQWKASLEGGGGGTDDVVGRTMSMGSDLTRAELTVRDASGKALDI